ncbi:hypothetical protein [Microcoleus sp. D3_18a_C4]|uniref:hypothetical protein n=1 Tax=Microcoleus sp. D3_18a_C4 TaxID=3055332 RepID=UPI002FD31681
MKKLAPLKGSYPYTQSVLRISSNEFETLKQAQFLFNKLYSLAVQDIDFISKALQPVAARCGFVASELEVYRSVELQEGKPRAVFNNNVFLQQARNIQALDTYKCPWIMTVANYLSEESALQDHFQINLTEKIREHIGLGLKTHLKEEPAILDENDISQILPAPMRENNSYIAYLAKLQNPDSPKIHYLTRTTYEKVTKAIEIQHFCLSMWLDHHVKVDVIFWDDLEKASIEYRNRDIYGRGDLFLENGDKVSLIFARTELFGHLTGSFMPHNKELWPEEVRHQLKIMDIYKNIQRESKAVFVPTSGERLVRSRSVEIYLKRNLHRFLNDKETQYLSQFFSKHWEIGLKFPPLYPESKSDEAHSSPMYYGLVANSEENSFIVKNLLRGYYRRKQAILDVRDGRNIGRSRIETKAELLDVISSTDDNWRDLFIMFPKIIPPKRSASIVSLSGEAHNITLEAHGGTVSEIALFGAYVQDSDGNNICNSVTGIGARTRPVNLSNPVAEEVLYGAIGTITVF